MIEENVLREATMDLQINDYFSRFNNKMRGEFSSVDLFLMVIMIIKVTLRPFILHILISEFMVHYYHNFLS